MSDNFPYEATKVVTALWEAAMSSKSQMEPDAIRAKFLAVEMLDKLHETSMQDVFAAVMPERLNNKTMRGAAYDAALTHVQSRFERIMKGEK